MTAPFMQLYVADYMADTRHLTCEQDGAYMRLLMAMWRSGGSLAADHAQLARIVGLSASRWIKIREDIMAFFDESDGFITQGRLAREYRKAEEKSAKRSEAGKSGADAKYRKSKESAKANAKVLPKHSLELEPELKVSGGVEACDALGWPVSQSDWTLTLIRETDCAKLSDEWPLKSSQAVVGWRETDLFEWRDVVAGIRAALVGKGDDPPGSWKYFSKAIARAKRDRLTKTPEPSNDQRRNRTQAEPSAGRSTDYIIEAIERDQQRRGGHAA